jgi:hypothetical protein
MNIPDEAVEAAARALAERSRCPEEWQWYLSEARTALEAAAPHLMAAAWDEAIDWTPEHRPANPYRKAAK